MRRYRLVLKRAAVVVGLFAGMLAAVPAHALGAISVRSHPQTPAFVPNWAYTTQDENAPDPDVVRFGNTYYAYTTGTTWGNYIGVLRSSSPDRGFATSSGGRFGSSALPSPPAWQVPNTQNAPGVFYIGGRYVMYYTAQTVSGHGGHYCLSRAISSSPTGPFVDTSAGPFLCMDAQGGVIDPSPFVDNRGVPRLYFKTYDLVERGPQPAVIYFLQLSTDGLSQISGVHPILSQLDLPNGNPPASETVENPQMYNIGGTYVLLYSRGNFNGSSYRQGYATCDTAAGPCHPAEDAFLTSYPNVLGPGGGTFFTDQGGGSWIAYQGWSGTPGCTGAQGTSCARKLFVSGLSIPSPPPACVPHVPITGYRLVASDGGIFDFGNQMFCGSTGGIALNQPIVGMARTADGGGYWLVARDGGIFTFGDAHFYGSTGGIRLNQPIVGMAATPSGKGYWLVASDGGMFSFGDARFRGSMGGTRLAQPIVGMAAARSGNGYWLVARDGGIFTFGDAKFRGSMGGKPLAQPIVGMAVTPSGNGYWFVASDGGMFSFGDARFHGSMGGTRLVQPVVGMAATTSGNGYWLVARDGGIFTFGDARFYGSTGGIRLNQPIVGMS